MFIKDLYYTLDLEYPEKKVLINGVYMTWKQAIVVYGDYSLVILSHEIIDGTVYFIIICKR